MSDYKIYTSTLRYLPNMIMHLLGKLSLSCNYQSICLEDYYVYSGLAGMK